jgi:hypothetical protein
MRPTIVGLKIFDIDAVVQPGVGQAGSVGEVPLRAVQARGVRMGRPERADLARLDQGDAGIVRALD